MTGHTSGGHFNPAVSIGLAATGNLPLLQMLVNIAAQVIGAIVGSGFLRLIAPSGPRSALGGNSLPYDMSPGAGCFGAFVGPVAACVRSVCRQTVATACIQILLLRTWNRLPHSAAP